MLASLIGLTLICIAVKADDRTERDCKKITREYSCTKSWADGLCLMYDCDDYDIPCPSGCFYAFTENWDCATEEVCKENEPDPGGDLLMVAGIILGAIVFIVITCLVVLMLCKKNSPQDPRRA